MAKEKILESIQFKTDFTLQNKVSKAKSTKNQPTPPYKKQDNSKNKDDKK